MERPILVVEDDALLGNVVCTTLLDEGYPVRLASNGLEALHAIEEEPPSLVLLDMHMPVLDGWGFARELRERGLELPLLVMTAAGRDPAAIAEEIGAASYISKPFSLETLFRQVEQYRAA